MTNSDIRISVSFKGHRKRKKLKAIIGPDATDYLLDLWIATAQNHPGGHLGDMDEFDIALEAGWDGDPKVFVDALVECKLLDKNGYGYILHDWEEHQPWVVHAPERTAKARNAAQARWNNATSMLRACNEQSTSNAPSPIPSPKPIPIPYQKIITAYHTVLPMLHPCKVDDEIRKTIKARWGAESDRQNIEWWEWYFNSVSECDFLIGRKTDFKATLPWLIGPKNMSKVLSGQYVNNKNKKDITDW